MKRSKIYRTAGRVAPLTFVIGAVACTPMLSNPPDIDVRPVATQTNPDAPSDLGYYQNAVDAIGKRDYGLALNFLQAARAKEPNSARVLNAFGVVYDKLGRFDLSARYYEMARAADPQSTIVANNLAYSHVLQQLVNGDITPAQLAAAGSASKAPVVTEAQAASSPDPRTNSPAFAFVPQPITMTARLSLTTLPVANMALTAPQETTVHTGDALAELQRPVREAMIATSNFRPDSLIQAAPPVNVEPVAEKMPVHSDAAAPSPGLLAVVGPDKQAGVPPASVNVYEKPASAELALAAQQSPRLESREPLLVASQAASPSEYLPLFLPESGSVPAPAIIEKVAQDGAFQPPSLVTERPARSAARQEIHLRETNTPRIAASAPARSLPALSPPGHDAVPHATAKQGNVSRSATVNPAARIGILTHHPLVIVNASAKKNADGPVRVMLALRNWSIAPSHQSMPRAISYTTLFYARADYPVARALERTLTFPIRLVPNACHCEGLRLVLGDNVLGRRITNSKGTARIGSSVASVLSGALQGARGW